MIPVDQSLLGATKAYIVTRLDRQLSMASNQLLLQLISTMRSFHDAKPRRAKTRPTWADGTQRKSTDSGTGQRGIAPLRTRAGLGVVSPLDRIDRIDRPTLTRIVSAAGRRSAAGRNLRVPSVVESKDLPQSLAGTSRWIMNKLGTLTSSVTGAKSRLTPAGQEMRATVR